MMNKLIKPLLSFILLIGIASCSSEPVLEVEKLQDGWYKNSQTTKPNKYKLDKNIYLYTAYDRQNILDDSPFSTATCVFRIYNLEKTANFTSTDQTLAYLNEIDTRMHHKWIASADSKNKYDTDEDGQIIDSIWFKQSDLPDDVFNPLHVNLTEFYAKSKEKITKSPVKTAYDECLQFFFDGAEKQTHTRKYNLDFLEKYREGIDEQYQRSDFEAVLKDGESLVRFHYYCNGANVLFLNVKHQLFISLSFDPRKTFPNPSCQY